MTINNPWVGYLDRGWKAIKKSVITRLQIYAPELTDLSENNPLIIILSFFSGIAETLHYYIDNMAREAFISTCRRYSSIVKLVQLVDYRVKAAVPASVDLQFVLLDSLGGVTISTMDITIPIGTICLGPNDTPFITTKTLVIYAGESYGITGALQKEHVTAETLGTSDGSPDQSFLLPENYANGTLVLVINGTTWYRQDTLGRSTPTDLHFIVDIKPDKLPYVVFGDGLQGSIPTLGADIIGDYDITLGAQGNVVAETITTISNMPAIPDPLVDTIGVTNSLDASAGGPIESLESIRGHAPLHIRTLDRAVTRQDYIDIAKLAPGVGKADVYFECGTGIFIYIVPDSGGIAQLPLLNSTTAYMDERRMINPVSLYVRPAGESYVVLSLNATLYVRKDPVLAKQDIEEALLNFYSRDNSDINRSIRLSDIIATVDNLEKVDFLDTPRFYLRPYARPYNTFLELVWSISILPQSILRTQWKISYSGTLFRLYRNGIFHMNLYLNTQYATYDGAMSIKILPSAYVMGMTWDFITYPYSVDTLVDNNTMVLTKLQYLSITVTEQFITQ